MANYEEFQLLTSDVEVVKGEGKRVVTFKVQVPASPHGELTQGVPSGYDAREMRDLLRDWERRELTWPEVIAVGHRLGSILFPDPVRELLLNSIALTHGRRQKLRIRLVLGGELHNVPWEYALVNRGGAEATQADFLALNPEFSLVRHQAATLPAWDIKAEPPARMVAVVSDALEARPLNLKAEREAIENALSGLGSVEATFIADPTVAELLDAAKGPVHFFHFAGHGDFETKLGDEPGAVEGEGAIILKDEYGDPQWLKAGDLALLLRKLGVRAALLGACRSGRRDNVNVWSSVATALLKADLGAAVGMQYNILDTSAAHFAREFYTAVAAGLTVDEAVTNGRIAVAAVGDVRGWGVPVLYLRASDGVLFPEYEADASLADSRNQIRVRSVQFISKLEGEAVGVAVEELNRGHVESEQHFDEVEAGAEAFGGKIGRMKGGSASSRTTAKTVKGKVTGIKIDKLG